MKNTRSYRRIIQFSSALSLLMLIFWVMFIIIEPAELISRLLGNSFNNPARINSVFFFYIRNLFITGLFVIIASWFYNSRFFYTLREALRTFFHKIAVILNLNTVLFISLAYLLVLFVIGIKNYDLGFDEAWYLEFADKFASSLIPYYIIDGRIMRIDTIGMFPYYIASLLNYRLGFVEVWHFKLLSTILSALSLIVIYILLRKTYEKRTAALFLLFLTVQPGFGFIAISFFGEMLQAALMFAGLYFWLKDPGSRKQLLLAALMFSLAVHTKFQLIFLYSLTLIVLAVADKKSRAILLLFYIIIITAVISLLRTIPVLLKDPSLVVNLALITDLFDTRSSSTAAFEVALNKIQLFNRFFPLTVFLLLLTAFFYYMKNTYERFLFYFSVITILWWIFLYPHSTYRNPFMGIITLCLMAAILMVRLYESFISGSDIQKRIAVTYVSALAVVILMFYGFSSNLIYAYVGYNDGVQFDMDGFKNRLFGKIERDNSQKEFYDRLKSTLGDSDTLYGGSFVAKFYVKNPVSSFESFKKTFTGSPREQYFLVTNDLYPLGFDEIYSQLDSLGADRRLIIKMPGHELYGITKKDPPPQTGTDHN